MDYSKVFVDLTSEMQNPPQVEGKHKLERGRVVVRRPQDVTGITVHQMAIMPGVSEAQVRAAGGNRNLALDRRALGFASHLSVMPTGHLVHCNPWLWWVYHGNGFNPCDLGLEVAGLFPGMVDRPDTAPREDLRTVWGGGSREITKLTADIIALTRMALYAMCELAGKEGCDIRYVHAHRQSSDSRRSDPGEGIWKGAVLEYAIPVLGLKAEPAKALPPSNRKDGPGRPIPVEWDPVHGVGNY